MLSKILNKMILLLIMTFISFPMPFFENFETILNTI